MRLRSYRAIIWLRLGIKNMNGLLLAQRTGAHALWTLLLGQSIQSVYNFGTLVIMCDVSLKLTIVLTDVTLLGARELYGISEKSIQYWLKLCRRGCDNP